MPSFHGQAAAAADAAGSGSALLMTLRQVGGAVGIALLGSLVAGTYAARLDTTGLPCPGPAADAAGESLSGAHALAERLGLPALARSADAAYVNGMAQVRVVCAIAALVTALPVAVYLPDHRPARRAGAADEDMAGAEADAGQ
ncbi:hypothetical protein ACFT8V_24570 [Streptomyces griseoincarnatus]